jgi:hypothetical protein
MAIIDDLLQDLRYGARTLSRSPAFTAIVVLSLALGIGANSAIFSLINAVFLRSVPVRDPAGLVLLTNPIGRGKTLRTLPVAIAPNGTTRPPPESSAVYW